MSVQSKSSIRNSHKMNKIKEINKVDNYYEKNDLANFIIKPVKIKKEIINIKNMAEKKDDDQEKEYEDIKKNKKMVNNPYKGIIPKKTEDVDKDLDYEVDYDKEIKESDDLIVHKIKEGDKDAKKFEKKYGKFKKKKKHDDVKLKKIYSENEKAKHIEKFKYNHVYKYSTKIDNDDENDDDLRSDRIEFYKKEQQKVECDKQKIDNIVNDLIESGIISDNMDSMNLDDIDIEELENKIKEIGGDVYQKIIDSA
jgi:hypothetical protein